MNILLMMKAVVMKVETLLKAKEEIDLVKEILLAVLEDSEDGQEDPQLKVLEMKVTTAIQNVIAVERENKMVMIKGVIAGINQEDKTEVDMVDSEEVVTEVVEVVEVVVAVKAAKAVMAVMTVVEMVVVKEEVRIRIVMTMELVK